MIHLRPLPNTRTSSLRSIKEETHQRLRREIALEREPDKRERHREAAEEFRRTGATA